MVLSPCAICLSFALKLLHSPSPALYIIVIYILCVSYFTCSVVWIYDDDIIAGKAFINKRFRFLRKCLYSLHIYTTFHTFSNMSHILMRIHTKERWRGKKTLSIYTYAEIGLRISKNLYVIRNIYFLMPCKQRSIL